MKKDKEFYEGHIKAQSEKITELNENNILLYEENVKLRDRIKRLESEIDELSKKITMPKVY